jgi:thiamine kinase-like enzyme
MKEESDLLVWPEAARALLDTTFGKRRQREEGKVIQGATNLVVRLRIDNKHFAIRAPRLDDANLQVDRHSECAAIGTAAAAGLGPEVVACDPQSGVLITRWLEAEVWTPAQTAHTQRTELIASVLQNLHRLPPPAQVRTLDLDAILPAYWTRLAPRLNTLPRDMQRLHRKALELLGRRVIANPRLCHNDLHCRNIVGTGDVRLLDWEYSGVGEPLFDLASYSQSNDLPAAQQRVLLTTYGATEECTAVSRSSASCSTGPVHCGWQWRACRTWPPGVCASIC